MKKYVLDRKLNREKEKLCKLVITAKEKGIPICQDKTVMKQNSKVDSMLIKIQRMFS